MKIRRLIQIGILWLLIGSLLGCFFGQPRVTVVTSTMVGLEAKPPMGDGQPNPAVSLAYKRAEMALIPVCQVPESSWWKSVKKSSGAKEHQESDLKTHKDSDPKTQNKLDQKECPPESSKDQDSYAVLGSFQMAHNWFGPLNIRQFIATGSAARHLATPTIHVIGEVNKPGTYPFKNGMTAKDAIAMAGDRTKDGSKDRVDLFSRTKGQETKKGVSPDTTIESGTVVEVPQVYWIHVIGEVNKTGTYPFKNGLTAGDAIAMAGGRTKDGSEDTVDLFSLSKDQRTKKSATLDTIIKSDTIVEVPQVYWIYVSGDIKNPGRYRYEEKMTRENALKLAGGLVDIQGKPKVTATQTDKTGEPGTSRNLEDDKAAVLPGDIIVVVIEP